VTKNVFFWQPSWICTFWEGTVGVTSWFPLFLKSTHPKIPRASFYAFFTKCTAVSPSRPTKECNRHADLFFKAPQANNYEPSDMSANVSKVSTTVPSRLHIIMFIHSCQKHYYNAEDLFQISSGPVTSDLWCMYIFITKHTLATTQTQTSVWFCPCSTIWYLLYETTDLFLHTHLLF
jgi:hypothetical protein